MWMWEATCLLVHSKLLQFLLKEWNLYAMRFSIYPVISWSRSFNVVIRLPVTKNPALPLQSREPWISASFSQTCSFSVLVHDSKTNFRGKGWSVFWAKMQMRDCRSMLHGCEFTAVYYINTTALYVYDDSQWNFGTHTYIYIILCSHSLQKITFPRIWICIL